MEKLSTVNPFKKDATINENTENQEYPKKTGNASGAEQEKDEDIIRVMALDNNEKIIENAEAEQEKKNHEIFY